MFGSTILEVAVGMVFIYLLLSLICSALNEFIEAWLKMRARDLEKGLLTLFSEPGKAGELSKQFFDHPLITALGNNPSYIPSRTFSLALWNIASTTGQVGAGVVAVTRDLAKIRATVAALPNEKVRRVLLTLLDEAGNDFDRARENVERWYDDVMDRVAAGGGVVMATFSARPSTPRPKGTPPPARSPARWRMRESKRTSLVFRVWGFPSGGLKRTVPTRSETSF